jgi:hypothetical protein
VRAQAGQSTVEYGALLLVALVLLMLAASVAAGTGIADAVLAQMRRALCVATGRGCEGLALAPCVTGSKSTLSEASLRVAVLRLSGSRLVLREQRSDGSVVLTLFTRAGAGIGASVGGRVAVGGLALGGSVGGTVEGVVARGRVWRLQSDAEAEALLRSLGAETARRNPRAAGSLALQLRDIPRPPEPDERFGEGGLAAELKAELGRAGIELGAQDLGGSRAERGGAQTLTLRRRNDLKASVAVLGAGVVGRGRHEERYGLRVDADGRPLELIVVETLGLDAGARLPAPLRVSLGRAQLPARHGSLTVLERRLDLTDAVNLAAARGFVSALRHPGLTGVERAAIEGALRERLDAAGSARSLIYDLGVRVRDLGAEGSVGVGLGGEASSTEETLRLVAASAHGPGEPWRERGDCLSTSSSPS